VLTAVGDDQGVPRPARWRQFGAAPPDYRLSSHFHARRTSAVVGMRQGRSSRFFEARRLQARDQLIRSRSTRSALPELTTDREKAIEASDDDPDGWKPKPGR